MLKPQLGALGAVCASAERKHTLADTQGALDMPEHALL